MVKLLKNKTCTHNSSHTRTCPEKFCQRAKSNETVLYNCTINYPKKPEYDNLFRDKGQFDPNLIHIMIPSRGRPDTSRLNYNHMMIENNQVSAYVQIVFVCPDEFEDYKKVWEGHCALVKLNDTQPDIEENVFNGGIGFSRRFIQRFASWFDIKHFFMADDNIVYICHGAQDKNVVSFLQLNASVSKIGSEKHQVPEKHLQFQRHEDIKTSASNTVAAFTGPLCQFGVIGFRKTRGTPGNFKSWFAKKHCCSLLFINNQDLLSKNVLFKPWKAWEDLHFCNEAEDKGLIVIKLNAFSVTKQRGTVFSDLYTWDENDKITRKDIDSYQGDEKSIEKLMTRFLKSLRISEKPHGTPFFDVEIKPVKEGTVLFWIKTIEELESFACNNQNITLILPMKTLINSKLSNWEDIKNLLSHKINQAEKFGVSIKSSHKPVVTNDFVVINITYSLPKDSQHDMYRRIKKHGSKLEKKITRKLHSQVNLILESKLNKLKTERQREINHIKKEENSKNEALAQRITQLELRLLQLEDDHLPNIKQELVQLKNELSSKNEVLTSKLNNLETCLSQFEEKLKNIEANQPLDPNLIREELVEELRQFREQLNSSHDEKISKLIDMIGKRNKEASSNEIEQEPKPGTSLTTPQSESSGLKRPQDVKSSKISLQPPYKHARPENYRTTSREDQYFEMITQTTFALYKNVKAQIIKSLREDIQLSQSITLNRSGQRESLDTCSQYQSMKCQEKFTHPEFNSRKHIIRHHICDFCYELLHTVENHPGAKCDLFKKLDSEFRDINPEPVKSLEDENDLRHKLSKKRKFSQQDDENFDCASDQPTSS